MAYTGTIKDEILDIEEIAVKFIDKLKNDYRPNLIARYKLENNDLELKNFELLNLIGKKRGCLIKGGEVDLFKTSNILLDDFRSGKLGRITLE